MAALRRRGPSAVLLAVAALAPAPLLAACGGDGHEYVTNSDAGVYLRVPDSWTVLEPEQDADPNTPDDGSDQWIRVLDSAEQPTLDHLATYSPADPLMLMQVSPLSFEERDDLSYSSLRSLPLGLDPVEVLQQLEAARVQAEAAQEPLAEPEIDLVLLDSDDLTTSDGYRGERVAFSFVAEGELAEQLNVTAGEDITIDHSAMVDAGTTQVLSLTVVARSDSYAERRDEIDDIVGSWTVEEPR
jgi:hypothetical protein